MAGSESTSKFVRYLDVEIETYVDGAGPTIVILPSYGRDSGNDFDDITARFVNDRWKVLRPQPRGVAGSGGPMAGLTLHDLANDVAECIRHLRDAPAVLLGHAFGQALARMTARDHPDLVKAVILAAAQASGVPMDIAEAPSGPAIRTRRKVSGWPPFRKPSSRPATTPGSGLRGGISRR